MTVADILALATVATQFRDGRAFTKGSVFARDHFNVAENAGPAWCAGALVRLVDLFASGSIETRSLARLAG